MKFDADNAIAFARRDAALQPLLQKFVGTTSIINLRKSPLVESSYSVIALAVQEARRNYAERPERLSCVVVDSSTKNAYALWGSATYDWIVLTEGLLKEVMQASEKVAEKLRQRWNIEQSELGRRMADVPPMSGGFSSALSSVLYVSAISFFVGHEAGHHLGGHDGYYAVGGHAEVGGDLFQTSGSSKFVEQALEFEADRCGAFICRVVTTHVLLQFVEATAYGDAAKKEYGRMLGVILTAGALMMLSIIRPKPVDWETADGKNHPPEAIRAIQISGMMRRAITDGFKKLTPTEVKWISLVVLDLVAEATIGATSPARKILAARKGRPEPVALRAVGLRKLFFDEGVAAQYMRDIDLAMSKVKPQLRPRVKR